MDRHLHGLQATLSLPFQHMNLILDSRVLAILHVRRCKDHTFIVISKRS
jgi:hypothetical protein